MSHDAAIEQSSPNYPVRDTRSFTSVFTTLHGALCAFAIAVIKCKHIAEDIVSNVFLTLWEQSLEFDRFEKIQNWLYKCTWRACLKYAKRNRYDYMPVTMMDSLLTDDDGPHTMPWQEFLTQVAIAVKKLPKQRRRVFNLTCIQSKDKDLVAKRLKISPKTVLNQKKLAIEQVREHLRQCRLFH